MHKILLVLSFLFAGQFLVAQDFNLVQRSQTQYPGETCANICGYAQNGREYALVGCSQGMRIVDVTNPDVPVAIAQIPGPNNLWKEIKVWKNYAYVTTEATGGGLQIVDLSGLPNTTVPYTTYFGDGTIAGTVNKIHALHIDTTAGFVHLFGATMSDGAAVGDLVLDLKPDPMNPVYVGKWDVNYIHDGYVNNDTLYGGHIYAGYFSVIDFKDKSNPVLIATTHTPGNFTHNVWPTGDGKHMLTTDEVSASFLASYDINDFGNIVEVDRFQTTPGSGSIVHNTHVREGKWAVTSWYKDGVSIVDCTRPWNLVEVARFDMFAGVGDGFEGTWGVYPFLPSGNLVCSGIDEGLFVLTPQYKSACFLEGKCTNSVTGSPVGSVEITLSAANTQVENSRNTGVYGTGCVEPGTYSVTFSKLGFFPQTHQVTLAAGQVTMLDVALVPYQTVTVVGKAVVKGTNTPVEGAEIIFEGPFGNFESTSDGLGGFSVSNVFVGDYQVLGGKWGFRHAAQTATFPIGNLVVEFEPGYQDDFFADLGWTNSATASTGAFELGEPIGTSNGNSLSNPELDLDADLGDQCYVSGNTAGTAAANDIDNGEILLLSPNMDLTTYQNPTVSFHYWFYNAGGQGTPNDEIEAWITNGFTEALLFSANQSNSSWQFSDTINVKNVIALTDMMKVRFRSGDDAPGHLVEAGIDGFWVGDKAIVGIEDLLSEKTHLAVAPNPFSDETKIDLFLPEFTQKATLRVLDVSGRLVEQMAIGSIGTPIFIGKNWEKGVYFVQIETDGTLNTPVKIVRI